MCIKRKDVISMKIWLVRILLCGVFCGRLLSQEYPIQTEINNGVKCIINPNYPREGKYNLELKEIFRIPMVGKKNEYKLSRPIQMKTAVNGFYYVLDWQEKMLVFDKKGKYSFSFGGIGEGPGEYKPPCWFVTKNQNIIISTPLTGKINYYGLNGKYVNSMNAENAYDKILTSTNEVYLISKKAGSKKTVSNLQYRSFNYVIWKHDERSRKPINIFEVEGDKTIYYEDKGITYIRDTKHKTFIMASIKDIILVCSTEKYEINMYNKYGKLLMKYGRNFDYIVDRNYKEGSGLSRYMPVMTNNTQCDYDGNMWVNIYSPIKDKVFIYDIFDEDGIYVKQVYSPCLINFLDQKHLYVFEGNDKGEITIIVYKYNIIKI